MTDEQALRRAILEQPLEDTPRLMYADEVEAGNPDRAEFIRVQVEIERLPPHEYADCVTGPPGCGRCSVMAALRRRERELWALGAPACPYEVPAGYDFNYFIDATLPSDLRGGRLVVRRGFADELWCDLDSLLGGGTCDCNATVRHIQGGCRYCGAPPQGPPRVAPGVAAEIFRLHPVTRVVTGKRPSEWAAGADENADRREWVWERDMSDQPNPDDFPYLGVGPYDPADTAYDAAVIPGEVFDVMGGVSGGLYFVIGKDSCKRYRTAADALDALSRAVVTVCRVRAGLPPLKGTE